jgi:hypothetical protein
MNWTAERLPDQSRAYRLAFVVRYQATTSLMGKQKMSQSRHYSGVNHARQHSQNNKQNYGRF